MKKITIYFYLALVAIVLNGCMASTQLEVLKPAAFAVQEDIKVLATINRTIPSQKALNVLEGVLTGEAIKQDREGSRAAIAGLAQTLASQTPRFKVVHTTYETEGGDFSMAKPLSWSEIDEICKNYQADAVVALESYDTDNAKHVDKKTATTTQKDGKKITTTTYYAKQNTRVTLGWRFYDPKNRKILDEFMVEEFLETNGEGRSEEAAIANMVSPYAATKNTSAIAGNKYGYRIAPSWLNVSRSYYKKGSPEMKAAKKMAKHKNWKGAADLWNEVAQGNGVKTKTQAKGYYNLALTEEINGNLNKAVEYAQKAHNLGLNNARSYELTLKNRIEEQKRIKEQMEKKADPATPNKNKTRPK
ncbi:MAG: hypothetical protein IPI59_13295 [Sphingobacteriales bacterium]|nr:hypothetical protein [Sphingobacteriales bacterium]MBK6889005.1 hypothetical protein [Sphingobacteriales bacterium]MBK7528493.1 hypothetical protein [Sphingobacteriales bacterium]MBP9140230.1 hypothetical protein [Chitinophagales bacterium]